MWTRRDLARLIALAAPFSIAAATRPATTGPAVSPRSPIRPKRLSPGDTVGLVLPASAVGSSDAIAIAEEQLAAIGLKTLAGSHALDRFGYFAGSDRDRASDVNAMFADDRVSGVVCYTGGWGSPRILPYLDFDLISRNPKVLIGYSDITALINAVHQRTGLITFHGPVGSSTLDPYTLENFKRVVMGPDPAGNLAPPEKKPTELVDRINRVLHLSPGKASGRLLGGNLTMISSLMGTPWQVATKGAILFLEDTHEEPYRIDRMLTQMALGGSLDGIAGFVFGRCTECESKGGGFSVEEVLRDRFGSLGKPAISGLSFGHIDQKLTLPIGVMATLDADAGTLRLDEPAVT